MKIQMIITCDLKSASLIEEVLQGTASSIEVSTKEQKATRKRYPSRRINKDTGDNLILNLLPRDGTPVDKKALKDAFKADGRHTTSVPSALARLIQRGLVIRTAHGQYARTEKAL